MANCNNLLLPIIRSGGRHRSSAGRPHVFTVFTLHVFTGITPWLSSVTDSLTSRQLGVLKLVVKYVLVRQ